MEHEKVQIERPGTFTLQPAVPPVSLTKVRVWLRAHHLSIREASVLSGPLRACAKPAWEHLFILGSWKDLQALCHSQAEKQLVQMSQKYTLEMLGFSCLFQSSGLKNLKHKNTLVLWVAGRSGWGWVGIRSVGFALIVFLLEPHVSSGQVCSRSTLDRIWCCLHSQVCRGVAGVTVFNVHVWLNARVNFLQG